MSGRRVPDASALVALLLDDGAHGRWAAAQLAGAHLLAPSLIGYEAANIIRRHDIAGLISADQAAQAHADLLDLHIEQWPYEILAPRAWELRANVSVHDASYVALAELAGATLVTLDRRLGRAPGVLCEVAMPRR